jgi:MFS family permease
MRQRFIIFSGIFLIMALSNAIVPVLPNLGETSTHQGAIFSTYFLGALITVFPAGIFSDRIGRTPFIRAGLILTCAGTGIILASEIPAVLLAGRLAEGIGAGLFLPVALSWANSGEMHEKMSGIFFASMNAGLVAGLVISGYLAIITPYQLAGLLALMLLTIFVLILSLSGKTDFDGKIQESIKSPKILPIISDYKWLFAFSVITIGATGAVTTLYPEFTGEDPFIVSVEIAAMNIATAVTVLLISRMRLEPIPMMQASAIGMAIAVLISYITPLGLIFVGGVAGVVMISQTAFLARTGLPQGLMMGLFSLFSYGGMSLIPFIAGVSADIAGPAAAFLLVATLSALMILRVHKCKCKLPQTG